MFRKRVIGVLFVAFFAISFLALVSAQETLQREDGTIVSVGEAIFDPVKEMFTDWEAGDLSVNVAKYAIWFLLVMVVYSVLSTISFLKDSSGNPRTFIVTVISIIVGFLSTAYLSTSEVYTILLSYSVLGVVLGGVIPFMILAFFTIEVSKNSGVGGRLLVKTTWVAFVVYLSAKLIIGLFGGVKGESVESSISTGMALGYLALIIVSLIFVFKEDKIRKYLLQQQVDVEKELLDRAAGDAMVGAVAVAEERAIATGALGAEMVSNRLGASAKYLRRRRRT